MLQAAQPSIALLAAASLRRQCQRPVGVVAVDLDGFATTAAGPGFQHCSPRRIPVAPLPGRRTASIGAVPVQRTRSSPRPERRYVADVAMIGPRRPRRRHRRSGSPEPSRRPLRLKSSSTVFELAVQHDDVREQAQLGAAPDVSSGHVALADRGQRRRPGRLGWNSAACTQQDELQQEPVDPVGGAGAGAGDSSRRSASNDSATHRHRRRHLPQAGARTATTVMERASAALAPRRGRWSAPALAVPQLRRHVYHRTAVGDQPLGDVPADAVAALDCRKTVAATVGREHLDGFPSRSAPSGHRPAPSPARRALRRPAESWRGSTPTHHPAATPLRPASKTALSEGGRGISRGLQAQAHHSSATPRRGARPGRTP